MRAADARRGRRCRPWPARGALEPASTFDLSKFLKPAFAGFENSYPEGISTARACSRAADARRGLLARPLSPPQHFDLSKFLKPA